jgi:flagellin-like protein
MYKPKTFKTKILRSTRAISPVVSTLLLIAIVVVASLVAYAWITGYMGSTTNKAGHSILIQSSTYSSSGLLVVYVQNNGQGTVNLKQDGSVYVNDVLKNILSHDDIAVDGNLIPIIVGQTVKVLVDCPFHPGDRIKIVTVEGTAIEAGTQGSSTNNAPAAAFFVSSTNGLTANFDASISTDSDGSITSYAWTFGPSEGSGTGMTTSHTYTAAGTYLVTLTVTDNGALTNSISHQVTVALGVNNNAPHAEFTFSTTDLSATFDASTSYDTDGTIDSYAWTFGDGSTGTGVNPTHIYTTPNKYTVSLTVTDNGGLLSSPETKDVTVIAAAPIAANVAAPTLNPAGFTVGGTFTALASVTGGSGTPTGNVQFQYSTNGVNWNTFDSKALVSGSVTSAAYGIALAAGSYSVRVNYLGDSTYSALAGPSSTLTVNPAGNGPLDHITVSMSPASIIAGQTSTGTATGFDAQNHNLGPVTATWSIPAGGDGGSWTTNVYTSHTAGTYTVQASYSGKTATAPLTVNSGALDHISALMSPASVVAGSTSTGTATGFDAQGNSLGVVSAVWSIPAGTDGGSWTDNVYTSHTAGTFTVQADCAGKTITTQLVVSAGALDHISALMSPASVVAGSTSTGTATAYDALGNSLGVVSASWSIPAGGDGGSWTTNVYTSHTVGTYTVQASYSGKTATAPLTVTVGPLFQFTITGYPTPVTADQSFGGVTVTAFDAYSNLITGYVGQVYFTTTDTDQDIVLPYTVNSKYTFTTGDSGSHTFAGFILQTPPSQTITVTDGATSATSSSITVNSPGNLDYSTSMTPTTIPTSTVASYTYTITRQGWFSPDMGWVRIQVPAGFTSISVTSVTVSGHTWVADPVSGNTINVHAQTSNDEVVWYSGGQSVTVVFSATSPASPGTYGPLVSTAYDNYQGTGSPGTLQGTDPTITVYAAGVLNHFTITGYPTSLTAGQTFGSNNVVVRAYDGGNNILTGYTGQIYFTSIDSQAILPFTSGSKYTFVSGDNGQHTFPGAGFTLKTSGTQTITVTDGAISATSNSITVSAAAASKLVFTVGAGQTLVAGQVSTRITVERQDQYGNPVTTGGQITVSLGTTSGGGGFYSNSGGTGSTINHVHIDSGRTDSSNYQLYYKDTTVGTPTLTATSGSLSGTTQFTIIAAGTVLDHFVITGSYPTSVAAGQSFGNIIVTAYDAANNIVTGYRGQVYFTSTDPAATMPYTTASKYTFTSSDNGRHTFPSGFILGTVGSKRISVTDDIASATSNAITVNPGSLHHFTIAGAPSSTTSGVSFGGVTVTAYDAYNNLATNYRGQVYFQSTDGSPTLPYTSTNKYTFTSVDSGVHTFLGFTLRTIGQQTITVTDGTIYATTPAITVTAALDHLTITGYPTTVTVNQPFGGVVVTAYDSSDNVLTSYTGQIYFTATGEGATLPYTSAARFQFALSDAGIHIFSGFEFSTAGSKTITVTDGSISDTTGAITVISTGNLHYSISMTPISSLPSTAVSYTYTATRESSGSSSIHLGWLNIQIPAGFTSLSVTSITASMGTWVSSISNNIISIHATNSAGELTSTDQTVNIVFSATAPSTVGTYGPIVSTAYQTYTGTGSPGQLDGSDPSISVYNAETPIIQTSFDGTTWDEGMQVGGNPPFYAAIGEGIGGTTAAKSDPDGSNSGAFSSDPIYTLDASVIHITFMYRVQSTDDQTDLRLAYSYVTNPDLSTNSPDFVYFTEGNIGTPGDTNWHSVSITISKTSMTGAITDINAFATEFHFRFESNLSNHIDGSIEMVWIDDLLITKTP